MDGWMDLEMGQYHAAVPKLERAAKMEAPPFVTAILGYAYGASGDRRMRWVVMDAIALPVAKRAGILLGLGLGGFVDGILLHQIVHWHNMGSAVVPPTTMEAMADNMRWDGFFHAAVWLLTVIGVYWLLTDARRGLPLPDGKAFTGLLILGWGLFNLVEGIIDHHILGLHHVRDLPVHVPLYDWLFLGIGGVGFILLGWMMARVPMTAELRAAPEGHRP